MFCPGTPARLSSRRRPALRAASYHMACAATAACAPASKAPRCALRARGHEHVRRRRRRWTARARQRSAAGMWRASFSTCSRSWARARSSLTSPCCTRPRGRRAPTRSQPYHNPTLPCLPCRKRARRAAGAAATPWRGRVQCGETRSGARAARRGGRMWRRAPLKLPRFWPAAAARRTGLCACCAPFSNVSAFMCSLDAVHGFVISRACGVRRPPPGWARWAVPQPGPRHGAAVG